MIVLETARLSLREMTEADAADLLRLSENPNVIKYLPDPPLTSVEDALGTLRSIVFPQYARRLGRWAVTRKDTGKFIGWCGLKYYPESNEYDLGYRLFEDQWGRGYATEAAQGVLQYGIARLPNERIVGKAMVGNVASRRVLEKIGLSFESYVEDECGTVAVYRHVWGRTA